ncbi:hypothetical protein BT93_L5849 [Corymbia citriodora subsp. variegata]|uniref:Uncharacterized protein n=1 Tax=Corymbia citriodora subsp. variegata TaxID=360336 RepID=A0A8T0CRC7_CORYI|nr:hypothetical protein BT93_L5849 [Corymbia citriodora subsp. variegata]
MALHSNDTDWIVQLNEQQSWEKWSIYRVPTHVTDNNRMAYRPLAVSFGPYHHGEEHLLPMEEHKYRALHRFLTRSGKPFEHFLESLRAVVGDLMASYVMLDPEWIDGGEGTVRRFLQLMITDGCFMLEILRYATDRGNDYEPNDPIFSNYGMVYIMKHIRRDMLVLENQLPMLVLDRLVAAESNEPQQSRIQRTDITPTTQDKDLIIRLILNFCSLGTHTARMGKCLHVLDVVRNSLLYNVEKTNIPHEQDVGSEKIIQSAVELNYAGIRFEKSKTNSLRDISYARGVLRLPVIEVEDTTESVFLNLIAFERFHIGAGYEVTSFISFMEDIIANERDVELLQTRGIIRNAMGSEKAVAELFHSLSKDVALDPESSLDAVRKRLKSYCQKPWIMWKANLIRTYFGNPWAVWSLIAAIFALALSIIQTAYTVLKP